MTTMEPVSDSRTERRPLGGFTIVELLIVIVVIGILAAIVIVAYNGISNKASASSAQTAVQQATRKIATYVVTNGDTLPATLTDAGVVGASGTTFSYRINSNDSPSTYCVAATVKGQSYFADTNNYQSPTAGLCPSAAAVKGPGGCGVNCYYVVINYSNFIAGNYTVTCYDNGAAWSIPASRSFSTAGSLQLTCYSSATGHSINALITKYGMTDPATW